MFRARRESSDRRRGDSNRIPREARKCSISLRCRIPRSRTFRVGKVLLRQRGRAAPTSRREKELRYRQGARDRLPSVPCWRREERFPLRPDPIASTWNRPPLSAPDSIPSGRVRGGLRWEGKGRDAAEYGPPRVENIGVGCSQIDRSVQDGWRIGFPVIAPRRIRVHRFQGRGTDGRPVSGGTHPRPWWLLPVKAPDRIRTEIRPGISPRKIRESW